MSMKQIICFVFPGLYTKGLIYIDVPIADDDYIVGKDCLVICLWLTVGKDPSNVIKVVLKSNQ